MLWKPGWRPRAGLLGCVILHIEVLHLECSPTAIQRWGTTTESSTSKSQGSSAHPLICGPLPLHSNYQRGQKTTGEHKSKAWGERCPSTHSWSSPPSFKPPKRAKDNWRTQKQSMGGAVPIHSFVVLSPFIQTTKEGKRQLANTKAKHGGSGDHPLIRGPLRDHHGRSAGGRWSGPPQRCSQEPRSCPPRRCPRSPGKAPQMAPWQEPA